MSAAAPINSDFERAVEARLNIGVPGYWYPVLPSYRVADVPVGITRLGEKLALWRDGDGQVHALEDRCPHRGARLSLGWNLGNRIACWYHGVEVGGDGKVVAVPAVGDCPLAKRGEIKSYSVEEHQGAIFVYFPVADEPAPPLDLPEQLVSDEYSSFLCTAHWKCNYRYAVDNVMDPMHGAYLHAQSHSMAEGAKSAEMATRKTDTGFIFEKTGQSGVNFDWVEWGETTALWMRLEIPYRAKSGPGGPFGIIGFATPLDADNTMVFFWRVRRVSGWQRSVWRFLYRTQLEALHWQVLEQDRIVLETMAADARDQEFLVPHDAGLGRVRLFLDRKVREQLKARQTA